MEEKTHPSTAVALLYPEGADAPFIIAKGKNRLAEKIVHIAAENNIEIVHNTEIAHILSVYDIGDAIPSETYEAIAIIFAFLKKFGVQNDKVGV